MTSPPTRIVYADSSALVKRVVVEDESAALERELLRLPTTVVTSQIAVVEVTRAVGVVDPEQLSEVDVMFSSCALVGVSDAIITIARGVTSLRLRSLDAIHLATALHTAVDAIAVYDSRLADAAIQHGLQVIAPTS